MLKVIFDLINIELNTGINTILTFTFLIYNFMHLEFIRTLTRNAPSIKCLPNFDRLSYERQRKIIDTIRVERDKITQDFIKVLP